MSKGPKRIIAWWPVGQQIGQCADEDLGIALEGAVGIGTDYVRADVADEVLAALKLASRELTADGERERGPTIRAAIAKAEGRE